eukprot:TRINITY_DN10781_c0_g1_i2.p2 TRINITY_DN10781_c0_g1~~TRINITY_DN10781_c0_g1_i2.p2  ORF type:complete len:103 (+),score=17.26 TRINITY_DN10781_c0_g1_i2:579-887(+)
MRNLNSFNGGLYILQSTINHSCAPNVCVDEVPTLLHIRVRALRDIQEGEQLTQTYVAPHWTAAQRRDYLNQRYLFQCYCSRCEEGNGMSMDDINDICKTHTN